jgi:hypothetical protein
VFTSGNGSWFATRPLTFEYRWTRNGTPISGATSQTYTSVSADEGQTLRCEVRATNAFGVSSYIASSNSSTGVSLPVNTVAPVISGSTTLGSVLTTTDGTWTGTSPITFSYQWKRGGVSIGGATSSTYTLVAADSSANITCEVTGTNVAGSVAANSNTITAQNFNLVNTVAPVISGSNTFGSVLTTTDGTWTGASPITYGYQWKRNGSIISGATNQTYTLVLADNLANITCDVTATNPLGSVTAGSNTITAGNFNPINTVAPTLSPSGTQSTGTVITLGNGTWSGATPITFEYRWLRDNSIILGQTSNTYTLVSGDDLKVIKGEVRATNALSTSAYVVTSNQVDAVDVDVQAQAHYNRVIADGGVVPSGLSGVNAFFIAVKAIYGTSDITTAISVGLDAQVLGYKLGAGAGTTAGQAAQKLYSCSGASGDVVQTTAASQPLLLVHTTGSNYLFVPRIASNNCTTPRTISTGYNADFEIEAKVKFQDLTGTFNYPTILAVSEGYSLGLGATNGQLFVLRNGGNTAQTTATISVSFDGYVRVVRVGSSYTYYTSNNGTTWTLFEVVTGSSDSFNLTGTNTTIGGYNTTDNRGAFNGNIYRVRLWINGNRTTGSLSIDFNPNQYNAANSQTQWVSTSGETWTINTGTATTGYKGVLVDRTELQSDGVDDVMSTTASLNITLNTRYAAINLLNLSGSYFVHGKNGATNNRHLWWWTGVAIQSFSVGSVINFTGIVAQRLTLLTTNWNTTSSNNLTNNANQANGILASESFDTLELFGAASFPERKNSIINTFIETSIVNTPTQRTAMYDYIKSINNNAF